MVYITIFYFFGCRERERGMKGGSRRVSMQNEGGLLVQNIS